MKIALIYDRVYPWLKGGGEKALWDIACELRLKQASRPLELPESSEFHCRMSERLSGDASKR